MNNCSQIRIQSKFPHKKTCLTVLLTRYLLCRLGLNELSLSGQKNTRFSVIYSLPAHVNFMLCTGGLNYVKNNNVNIVSSMPSDLARNTQTIESVYLLLLATKHPCIHWTWQTNPWFTSQNKLFTQVKWYKSFNTNMSSTVPNDYFTNQTLANFKGELTFTRNLRDSKISLLIIIRRHVYKAS